jgi:predicted dithiol-disulfide oxidoreductase (DUF899 family)
MFHTYSACARGAEGILGVYALIDMVPKGRDEGALPYTIAWVRHDDRND